MKSAMSFVILLVATLLLHGLWEHTHIVLYTGYEVMEGVLPVWVLATLGDLVYTLVIVGIISLVKRDISWVYNGMWSDYCAAALLGLLMALMVEYKGLYLGRWDYLPSMPLVPLLGVGISPLLQMTILTPLSLFITKIVTQKFSHHV